MPNVVRLLFETLNTPIGVMLVVTDEEGNLRATDWTDHEDRMREILRRQYGAGLTLEQRNTPSEAATAIARYFRGDLAAIDSLPVKTEGTPFQQEVWQRLRHIACGTTISYGDLAQQIGRPAAVRAVGLANGANPVGLVVPCHRVIGANGSLTGYGGGLHRKRWLLQHEGAMDRTLLE